MCTQLELNFGEEEKRAYAKAQLLSNKHYNKAFTTNVYCCESLHSDEFYNIRLRVFEGPEVEWYFIMKVSFDVAAYFIYNNLVQLHWTLRDDKEQVKKFKEWTP